MSEPEPRPTVRQRLRGKAAAPVAAPEPAASAPAAGNASAKRRAVRAPLIQVNPADVDEKRRDAPLAERLKKVAKAGVPGLLTSFGLHFLVLVVMALIAVRGKHLAEEPALELGWLVPAEVKTGPVERPNVPIRIDSVQFQPPPKDEPQAVTPQPQANDSKEPQPVPVKEANVSRMLDGRSPRVRDQMLKKYGGNDQTEQAISRGLSWLARQQQPAGNWRLHEGYPDAGELVLRTDTGATALALLAFLGAGHTHQAGEHPQTVRKGIEWLKGIQKPDGDFHDHIELGRQTAFYAHSQATLVFCEAFAMTRDEELRGPAERGVAFLVKSQQPTQGGWKYMPQDATTIGDLSVTGWALMALHTARAAGITVSRETFERSSRFLDSVQVDGGARYKYMPTDSDSRASAAMTAEGLLCRQFLGWPKEHPALLAGVAYLQQPDHRPEWSAGRRNVYHWYYAAQVLHNQGGDEWKQWYAAAQEAIVANQAKLGSKPGRDVRGSWNPHSPPGSEHEYSAKAGRLYLTALCLLVLESPYRHWPMYEDHAEE